MKAPRILAWEATSACNLECLHCRASATPDPKPGELTTGEARSLLEEVASAGTKLVILSGGESLMRDDIFELASYGTSLGMRMTLATNGSLVTNESALEMKKAGIARVSVSLDGVTAHMHDRFRGRGGSFDLAVEGIEILVRKGMPVQVNTTVAAMNVSQMADFPAFLEGLGVMAWHVFFLVPTGRGVDLEPATIREYKDMLDSFYTVYKASRIECKATCAPQFYRLLSEKNEPVHTKGCLAGSHFGFVSSTGIIQPCGFLQIPCGDIRDKGFSHAWENSLKLLLLRDEGALKGKCGRCLSKSVCGGCRARAHEVRGDLTETDPICWYRG
ncbi:MAG TPA: radical SAM protein [Deltaproteobacteria bacterium]|jgi:radical SAM protein with 4Fe4S-binding SPASM domain|nr:radical SAM protein [Deltaproteobacteria bacterium]HOI07915.1 radical SAM protein [Deltaproteobacteria bacterium]